MNIITAIAALVVKELFRRKDFYVVFVLTALITLVMGSVNFFNDAKIARYLKEIVLLLIWIASLVIALATTARQIPSERENRTIFPLLAKPVTRSQVIFGKFLGSWIACGAALAIFYIFFLIISGTREPHWQVGIGFQAFWLHWMMLGIVVAMTMFGSIIFAAPSSNTTIVFVLCAGILLIGRHLNKVAVQMHEPLRSTIQAVYFSVPHLEFFDVRDLLIHDWEPLGFGIMSMATLYAFAYMGAFLAAACWAFRRKPLNT